METSKSKPFLGLAVGMTVINPHIHTLVRFFQDMLTKIKNVKNQVFAFIRFFESDSMVFLSRLESAESWYIVV